MAPRTRTSRSAVCEPTPRRVVVGAGAFQSLDFTVRGVGSNVPLAPGATEREKQQNRRVSFRVDPRGLSESRTP